MEPVKQSFELLPAAARAMRFYPHNWWFAGGWAIDLFVRRVTREHEDIEIGVFRENQMALREHLASSGWDLSRCVDGNWQPWPAGDWVRLTDFQLKATQAGVEPGEIDFFLDNQADGRWICRRHPAITVAIDEFTIESELLGTPARFLRPEIQLLFKAKYHRPKDEADFEAAVVRMSDAQREWLREALHQVHPGDVWISRL